MRLPLFVSLLLMFCLPAIAQQATVHGIITGERQGTLSGASIRCSDEKLVVISDNNGIYTLQITANKNVAIEFSYRGFATKVQTVNLKDGENKKLNVFLEEKIDTLKKAIVLDKKEKRDDGMTKLDVKTYVYSPSPNRSIEKMLGPMGANSNNELSSQYSVRGGNFDENLVYVNDFEIFRPLLVKSGESEGLSFINPDLVGSVLFSTGGFQSKYGDKLSSVLDVDYKKPKEFGGSVSLGALGGSAHLEGSSKNGKFTYIAGARYKTTQYILGTLDTKGNYRPVFGDLQGYFTYAIDSNTSLEYIVNGSYNKYQFTPEDRVTTFGNIKQVLRLSMFFDGQEVDKYNSIMNGLAITFHPSKRVSLKFLSSVYYSREDETSDIIGDYFIGEVQTDLSKSDFGQVLYSLGVGETHDWSRNFLDAAIFNLGHRGSYYSLSQKHFVQWGATVQHEYIKDKQKEWEILDSAGYHLPYVPDYLSTASYIKSGRTLRNFRYSGFIQDTWQLNNTQSLTFNYGIRASYWEFNKQLLVSPRFQLSFQPKWKHNYVFRAAAGAYDQAPFYREMRDFQGVIHDDVKAQRSIHFVLGADYNLKIWDRPFKFITEAYYKYLYDVNPYEVDNVRIRYYANNRAKGYAAGIDFRLNGELVKDVDSWVSLSFLQTRENLLDDFYYTYDSTFNNTGEVTHIDSSVQYPGYIARPSDQTVTFNLYLQDYIPGNKNFKVHLNLIFSTGLPTGPPDLNRYRDNFRLPFYRRVDIGFSALLLDGKKEKYKEKFWSDIKNIWVSLEIFNLLAIQNTISYLWIKDYSNTTYAVPNYLTSRLINLRAQVNF